jgi:DNA-binding MarR family transcriptional regulator
MSRPFALIEEETSLAIMRTADLLQRRASEILKPFDITAAQYNVLRILRGSPSGLACSQISERLITHDPDVTRLLDRMEAQHWIKRKRSAVDRRVVLVFITAIGIDLLEEIKPFITAYHRQQFSNWGEKTLKQLLALLARIRETDPQLKQENEE